MSLNLKTCLMTNNPSYKSNRHITPVGIIVHSTGVNNPYLKRYIQPDDGNLGVNQYANDFNHSNVEKSVHAFIGLDKNDKVKCYQTLPFNIACWGVGGGSKGSYNYDPVAHIQFEICEDNLKSKSYFTKTKDKAVELCVYLCRKYKFTEKVICSHKEANQRGYGSPHGDPVHWWSKFNYTMDMFRTEIAEHLKLKTGKLTYFNKNKNLYKSDGKTKVKYKDLPSSLKPHFKKGKTGNAIFPKNFSLKLIETEQKSGKIYGIFTSEHYRILLKGKIGKLAAKQR